MTVPNNPKLKQRLTEIKSKAGYINYNNVPIIEGIRSRMTESAFQKKLDERVIPGYVVTWGTRNYYGEKFPKGCLASSINQRGPKSNAQYKLTFLWQHHQDDPLAQFAVMEEDDFGGYFETKPLDDVPNADRALKQVRSGTLNQFSMGFNFIWSKIEYDDSDDSIVPLEIDFLEGSIVTIGADQNTKVARNIENLNNLHDEIEDFIITLPRKDRVQARQLFTRQKALIEIEPPKQAEELEIIQPPENRKIDWDWIIKQL